MGPVQVRVPLQVPDCYGFTVQNNQICVLNIYLLHLNIDVLPPRV